MLTRVECEGRLTSVKFAYLCRCAGTVGAMDLGGASTQISLQLPATGGGEASIADAGSEAGSRWGEDADPVAVLALYGRNYSFYSQSCLCYGVLEVFRRYQAMIIQVGADFTVLFSLVSRCARMPFFLPKLALWATFIRFRLVRLKSKNQDGRP